MERKMISIANENYYTAKELSVKFNVSMETIRRWRTLENLNAKLIGKRKYMYSESDIKKFLEGK